MTVSVPASARDAFYAAALAGMRLLDARERVPRRFGQDADTRWNSFKGGLTPSDRIDFLLRDAAVAWGAAFSPADVFGLFGLAPDEPFGPDWEPLSATTARRHLKEAGELAGPAELGQLLGVETQRVQVPELSAATRIAVAGGAALIAVAQAFAEQPGLSWSDQVLAIATAPENRQLAGLLAIATDSAARTRLTRPDVDVRTALKRTGFAQLDTAVVTTDAEPDCTDFARRVAGVA
jgi:hypothetical protein